MKIILCEDNTIFRNKIKKIIVDFVMMEGLDVDVVLDTANPENVLDYIETNGNADCYFLDIDLGEDKMSGLDLASEIRKNDFYGDIIFLTSHDSYFMDTFARKLKVLDYIVKTDIDNIKKRITETISEIFDSYTLLSSIDTTKSGKLFLKTKDEKYLVNLDDILYFTTEEKSSGKIIAVFKDKTIVFYSTLKQLLNSEKLNGFYLINRSTLVNINEVHYLKDNFIYMSDGNSFKVSDKHRNIINDFSIRSKK